jgi:hypothetical protein
MNILERGGKYAAMFALMLSICCSASGQAPELSPASLPQPMTTPAPPLYTLEDGLLEWPPPAGDTQYAEIDGKHLHQFVVEQAAISDHYRDKGHPQFWGRIIGTSSDEEDMQWLVAKFKSIGLSDVRIQSFDLPPQLLPQSWEVTAKSEDKNLHLDRSAQPAYLSPGTAPEGIDLEAVWAGTGSEADFAGRDVRAKPYLCLLWLCQDPCRTRW